MLYCELRGESMRADCHMHMILDGVEWRNAIARHKEKPDEDFIRQVLKIYQVDRWLWSLPQVLFMSLWFFVCLLACLGVSVVLYWGLFFFFLVLSFGISVPQPEIESRPQQ